MPLKHLIFCNQKHACLLINYDHLIKVCIKIIGLSIPVNVRHIELEGQIISILKIFKRNFESTWAFTPRTNDEDEGKFREIIFK